MLVCKYCGRSFREEYKNCPGCGSNDLEKKKEKFDYVIETPPKDGYISIKNKYKNQNRQTIIDFIMKSFTILIFIIIMTAITVLSIDLYDKIPLFLCISISIELLLYLIFVVIYCNVFLLKKSSKYEELYKTGIVYKNIPYDVEYTTTDNGLLYYIVVKHKIYDGKVRKFKSEYLDSTKDFITKDGSVDLIVHPKDPNIFSIELEIY